MCGIFGYIKGKELNPFKIDTVVDNDFGWANQGFVSKNNYSSYSNKEDNIIENLLMVSMLRGIDATGFAVVDHSLCKHNIYKAPVHGLDFMKLGDWKDVLFDISGNKKGLIGHVRKGTTGSISNRTSHPFEFGDLVGVHNGTLYGWSNLWSKAKSDSEALYFNLSQETDTYENILKEINGAYALVWYHRKYNKYFFSRNTERPLWYIKNSNLLLFASEFRFLRFALERELGKDGWEKFLQESTAEEFKTGRLYEFDPDKWDLSSTEIPQKKYNYPAKSANNGNVYNYSNKKDKHSKKYDSNKSSPAKDLSHFTNGQTVEFIPCSYDEFESKSGTVYGYIPPISGSKKHWHAVIYSVPNVKEWWEKNRDGGVYVFGTIKGIYPNTPRVQRKYWSLGGVEIFPEMLESGEYITHSIDFKSVLCRSLVEDAEYDDVDNSTVIEQTIPTGDINEISTVQH